MTRLIDAEPIIKIIDNCLNSEKILSKLTIDIMQSIKTIINSSPTIDAEPVRYGQWIKHGRGRFTFYECSNCGEMNDDITNTYEPRQRYCPICGAKMVRE